MNGPPKKKAAGGSAASETALTSTPADDTPREDPRKYAVFCVKHDGSRKLFDRYATRSVAEQVVATFLRIGGAATVEELES